MTGARAAGPRSRRLFARAARSLAGGVDSPVRAFRGVGGSPVFFARGAGAFLTDVDGRRYLDLVNSWGATILGHAPARVVAAVHRAARRGLTFGAPTEAEHRLAETIRAAVPEMERLRFVTSGTEATMSAVRVARGFTGRSLVVKFAGGYHGHSDGLLARAGSGALAPSVPDSAGVPPAVVAATVVARYNDLDGLAALFEAVGERVAAVLVEPVAGNMGVVPPVPGFLAGLSRLARRHGALVIADEVITGFRLRRGAVGASLGARADLVTLGKVIGGGLPVGAYGGRREILATVAPTGPVYQAGTLAGNPVAMAAGSATLAALGPGTYDRLEALGDRLAAHLRAAAESAGVAPFTVERVGSMLGLFFAAGPIRRLDEARASDARRYAAFFHAAARGGVYFPPSPWETAFVSAAMRPADLDAAVPALRAAFRAARRAGGGRR